MAASSCLFRATMEGLVALGALLSLLAGVCSGIEQMVIVSAPDYVRFRSGELVRVSQVPDILSAVWGFTTTKDERKWSGLEAGGNPFKRPEAVVVVEIEGFHTLQMDSSPGKVFPLETDVEPGWPYQLAADRTYVRFAESNPVLMEIVDDDTIFAVKSQYSSLLRNLPARPSDLEDAVLGPQSIVQGPLASLNASYTPDMKCLMDIQLLVETARIIAQKSTSVRDGVPDLYWFRIPGLQELISVYGSGSPQVAEGMKLMMKAVDETKKLMTKAYERSVVVMVLGVDYQTGSASVRLGRSLLQTALPSKTRLDEFKVSRAFYNDNYPAAFNIIFVTMLIFALAAFGVALGMWHIDPGRDSIIYRMTSTRMKKEQ